MTTDLRGRTALVTGGSRGIGAAVVRALADAGITVAINYRARADTAARLARSIDEAGGRAVAIAADVSQADAVARLVERAQAELGPIDILVNNAGIAITRGIDDLSEDDFDRTIAVNLKSVFLCTQAVLPGMRARRWGRIVNISSGAARGAGSIGPHYNASKAGVEGMTRGYAARHDRADDCDERWHGVQLRPRRKPARRQAEFAVVSAAPRRWPRSRRAPPVRRGAPPAPAPSRDNAYRTPRDRSGRGP